MFETALINNRWELQLPSFRREFHALRPGWEAERLVTCFELMKEGDIVYDIGAEHGDFTALYQKWVGPTGTVVPVEPSPGYWPCIFQTFVANDLPDPRAWFAGFASDVVDLEPPSDRLSDLREPDKYHPSWPAAVHGPIVADFGFRHLAQQTVETPQITMDALAAATGIIPTSMVMDVEGAEYRALQGCKWLLEQFHPTMWVSIHPETMLDWYGATVEDIVTFMAGVGYAGEMLGKDSEEYWLFA